LLFVAEPDNPVSEFKTLTVISPQVKVSGYCVGVSCKPSFATAVVKLFQTPVEHGLF
jgi:hypothetical protein